MLKSNQFLGPLCKRGHEFENTGMSLRRPNGTPGGVCVECLLIYQKSYRLRQLTGKSVKAETFLGKPCRNGHLEGDQTRRYVSTGLCVQCSISHSTRHRKRIKNEQKQEQNNH